MRTLAFLLLGIGPLCHAQVQRVDEFTARLDARVPELMLREVVPSVAVAVVHDGLVSVRSWGLADLATARITTNDTRYNIASISKLLTAWGVMRLVEEGKVALDDPITKYVKVIDLPDEVTVRRLLSHSAGLSMPAVPFYRPDEPLPSIEEMLRREPLQLIDRPGKAHHYSGGGFALLQLMIEKVSGIRYEAFVEREILQPLGMKHTSLGSADAAVPYDAALRPLPHYRFAANAAAGWYTTIDDLAAFAAATVGQKPAPLSRESIALTQTAVVIEDSTPFRYGLGENLIKLPSGTMTTGHAGSNEGWTCVLAGVPSSGDALVVLTNRSDAFPLYRDVMCEWLTAAAGENWPRFCAAPSLTWGDDDAAFVDELFAGQPAAVLVAIGDRVVHRKGYGGNTPETAFYLASIAKSFTAFAVLDLVASGRMSLSDRISRYVKDVPEWAAGVTIEQLLAHTSGIPSYQQLIDWKTYTGMDNAGVVALLREKGAPLFAPGTKYAYSNSGYALLAMAVEQASGRPFRAVIARLALPHTTVYDGTVPAPANRAIGRENGQLSDYLDVTLPNGKVFPFRSTVTGNGGMFSTVDDLFRFARATPLPLDLELLAITPRAPIEGEERHGFGWVLTRRGKTNLIWNEGGMAGHRTMLVRIPDRDVTIVILANAAEVKVTDDAFAIADHLLEP